MNTKVLLFLLTGMLLVISSCKKIDDAPAATPPTSGLNLVNASADTVNFYLNGTRLNQGNLYPAGSSGYFNVSSGEQNYQVKSIFNQQTSVVKTLFGLPLKLDSGAFSSLFIAGTTADLAFKITDNLSFVDSAGFSYVRFVNASPDAGSLDMYIGDTVKFKNQVFKQASDFTLVGISSLKPINVYKAGSTTPIISGHVSLVQNGFYTFYVKGRLNGTGNSVLSVGTTLNAD